MKGIHIVKRRLADGRVNTHVYAFRGGPSVPVGPNHPDFETLRERIVDEFRMRHHREVSARGIKSEIEGFMKCSRTASYIHRLASKLVRNARGRAKGKKLQCDVTIEVLTQLLRAQDMKCAVSGLPFDLTANLDRKHTRNPFGPSIDRIDNSKGYIQGNVRIVLSAVNYGINEWGEDQYRTICSAVARYGSGVETKTHQLHAR
jgi:hypothetical protein